MIKRGLRIVLFVVIASLAASAGVWTWSRLNAPPSPEQASITADFSLLDLDYKARWLSDWQGKIVVLNFWATWCAPCRAEMPALVRMQRKYKDRGIQVVGIAIDTREAVAKYAAETGIDYPLLLADETGLELMARYGNTRGSLPFTVILGKDGTILSKKLGAYHEQELAAEFEALAAGDSTTTLAK